MSGTAARRGREVEPTARQRAEDAQRRASDPSASAWVGASAGSGKTKVLTDRVLRLLLREGGDPGRILCLTFTKAAAAEMATRLAARLGRWAVAEDADLRRWIEELTDVLPTAREMDAARKLFCRVLEQPGGMRIATIHSFCQSLLRSFPLEAGLPPQFALLEDADSQAMLAEAREASLAGGRVPPESLAALARLVSADAIGGAMRDLAKRRERLAPLLDAPGGAAGSAALLRAALGLPEDEREEDIPRLMAAVPEALLEQARTLLEHKNKRPRDSGARMLAFLGLDDATRAARAAEWWGCLHTKEGGLLAHLAPVPGMADESARLAALRARGDGHRLHGATHALLSAAKPVLADYAARKRRVGALDFDDLIHRARQLLRDPGSAWVLFKLDGGLDHLLLDEAQDTNPEQWGITEALVEEFFAGAGTRDPNHRTLFVVGDEKQSIFGFQGADARGFVDREAHFADTVRAARSTFHSVALDTSFRSCRPVLALVDAVFAEGPATAGVVRGGDALRHFPDRVGQAGLVEVWPALGREAAAEPEPWQVPEQAVPELDAEAQLAEALAARIEHMIRCETLPARGEGAGRPVRAGDVLVLVRRRTRLTALLVRQLKRRGVPVGGVDRIKLVEQIAVQDVLALCDAVLLPEDDLQLAAALKSPLLGLDEETLFGLAHGREGAALWHVLVKRRGEASAVGWAADWLAGLMDRADIVTPHALLSEVLGEHGGRARLLARLGAEASDALDELLGAALRHENRHPPSLQGFVHWLRRGGAEVRREAENAGDAVRIMTAHGAKGLQAPVVILPDVGRGGVRPQLLWEEEAGAGANRPAVPLWAPRKELQAAAWREAAGRRASAEAEEENRLLYVALTRAEDRLLVCGQEPSRRDEREGGWHALVRAGIGRCAGAEEVAFDPAAFGAPAGLGFGATCWRLENAQTATPVVEAADARDAHAALPEWAGRPAPAEASEDAVAPSRIAEGQREPPAAAPHGAGDPGGGRFRRGVLIHALLQFLPDHPEAARAALGRRHLARPGHGLSAAEQAATLAEVLAVIGHPALREAFGPDSLAEAPLAGRVAGGMRVAGQVDRLWIGEDRVLVVDYKTNRPPPERVEEVAPAYLRQMAAYRAVLRAAWPGRAVECALVWTWSGRVMELPGELLDGWAPGA